MYFYDPDPENEEFDLPESSANEDDFPTDDFIDRTGVGIDPKDEHD